MMNGKPSVAVLINYQGENVDFIVKKASRHQFHQVST